MLLRCWKAERRIKIFPLGAAPFSATRCDGDVLIWNSLSPSGGVQIVNSNRWAFTIGYKYQHISNGYRANFNPGVDVQMIFAGFSVFK
jgi:hypothetical protein